MKTPVKTCYISIPFGVKLDPLSGQSIDYDRVYQDLIRPAVEQAGLACQRADDFTGALIHKDIARAVITADVMIADVSGGNANVMYELGIRHALRRGATLVVSSSYRLPFDIANNYVLRYELGADGGIDAAFLPEGRARLAQAVSEKADRLSPDSPLFEYFPRLQVQLPDDLEPPEVRRRAYPEGAQTVPQHGPDRKGAVAKAERAVRGTSNVDPQAYLDVLRRYRDLGAWEDVTRVAGELPSDVAWLPQVAQLVAYAWSRLGDIDRAILVLQGQIQRSGGDPEVHGMLGSLYKKRHLADGSPGSLDAAVEHYRAGFERNRQDLSLGRNLVQLLHRRGTPEARSELQRLLPDLRDLARSRLTQPTRDFWTLDAALMLALLAGDDKDAARLADEMLAAQPDQWMLESSRSELKSVLERATDDPERARLSGAIERLAPPQVDEAEEADDAQL